MSFFFLGRLRDKGSLTYLVRKNEKVVLERKEGLQIETLLTGLGLCFKRSVDSDSLGRTDEGNLEVS